VRSINGEAGNNASVTTHQHDMSAEMKKTLRNISAILRDFAVLNPSISKQLHEIAEGIYNATR
jgi:hypothetical protein